MYTIDYHAHERVMHITATGFWSLATLAGFSTTVLARAAGAKVRHGDFATLIDIRDFPVQSHDVARGVELLLGQAMRITRAPVATATGSHLLRMQAERVLKADHSRVFLEIEDARAWLDDVWVQGRRAA